MTEITALAVDVAGAVHPLCEATSMPITHNDIQCHDEPLPAYSCSLFATGHLLMRYESGILGTQASSGKWRPVQIELRGTRVEVRSARCRKIYSLQYGQVGLAMDYYRLSNVVRVRAEGQQFLLATASLMESLVWVDNIQAAIDISLSVDDRNEPKASSFPRHRVTLPEVKLKDKAYRAWKEKWRAKSQEQQWLHGPSSTPQNPHRIWNSSSSSHDVPTRKASRVQFHLHTLQARRFTLGHVHTIVHPSLNAPLEQVPSTTGDQHGFHVSPAVIPQSGHSNEENKCRGKVVDYSKRNDDASNSFTITSSEALKYAARCARVLLQSSKWRYDTYHRQFE